MLYEAFASHANPKGRTTKILERDILEVLGFE